MRVAAIPRQIARYRWVILGVAFVAETGNALAFQAIAPLAPLFQSEMGLSKAEVGLFSSAAFIGAWGVVLIAGTLTDRFGVRKMLSLGQMFTGVLMLGMAVVGSFLQAMVLLTVAGLGRGASYPGISKSIMEWFPASERGTAMGLKQTGMPVAGVLAGALLPALALAVGWRGAIASVGVLIVLGGLSVSLLYRPALPARDEKVRFVSMRENTGQLLRNRQLWKLSVVSLLFVTVQLSLVAYLALYFADVVLVASVPDDGTRVVAAGGYLALCQVGGAFGRVFWGVLSDRIFGGRRLLVLAISGMLTTSLIFFTGYLGPDYPTWLLTLVVFAIGVAVIGWSGLFQAILTETAGAGSAATAVGMSMSISQSGKIFGPPLFGLAVDMAGSYQVGWTLLAVLGVLGTLLAGSMARQERSPAA